MQTAIDTELIEFEGWILRIRKSTHHAPRLLLLIHGLTGDENSMWVFARGLPSQYWMIAPRAPHAAEFGFSWRLPLPGTLRPAQGGAFGNPSLDQLRPAAEDLIRLVDEYSSSAGLDAGAFDLMGFSQGAVMCNVLAFLHPHRVGKTGILAGFVPSGLEELVTQRPLQGKPFFVAHGTRDEMVTIDRARASVILLEEAGAQVTYCEDEVGHKVSANCLGALREFLSK